MYICCVYGCNIKKELRMSDAEQVGADFFPPNPPAKKNNNKNVTNTPAAQQQDLGQVRNKTLTNYRGRGTQKFLAYDNPTGVRRLRRHTTTQVPEVGNKAHRHKAGPRWA